LARSKLSSIRYRAVLWIIIGMGFFYLYFIFKIVKVFVLIGGLAMFIGISMYTRAGHIATKAKEINCPECGKLIKVVSRVDACSKCKTKLIDEGRGVYKAVKPKK